MRDEFTQQNNLPGQVIQHRALNEFIARNYACDIHGRYFFQNGPQRVFITLDATPWIVRMNPNNLEHELITQCGHSIDPEGALSDEHGNIYIVGKVIQTIYQDSSDGQFIKRHTLTIALLHDHDLDHFSGLAKLKEEACSFRGSWQWNKKELPLDPVHSQELSKRYHFIMKPAY